MAFCTLQKKSNYPFFNNHPAYTYLDNGSTTLRPKQVITAANNYYSEYGINSHDHFSELGAGLHKKIQECRTLLKNWINAASPNNILFTSGATFSLNYICQLLLSRITNENNIVLTPYAHISLMGSFMEVQKETNCHLRLIECDVNHRILWNDLLTKIDKHTKILGITYMDNSIGQLHNIKKIIQEARRINPQLIVICDATQAIAHYKIDVQDLDADFIVFSGHKIMAPNGIGVMYWKSYWIYNLKPLFWGGGVIKSILPTLEPQVLSFNDQILLSQGPDLFEPGTPNWPGIFGLAAAIKLWAEVDYQWLHDHESELKATVLNDLTSLTKKRMILYNADLKNCILTFNIKGADAHDCAAYLNKKFKIIVRSGDACAKLIPALLNCNDFIRVSFAIYNTLEDATKLAYALNEYVKRINETSPIIINSLNYVKLTSSEQTILIQETHNLFHRLPRITNELKTNYVQFIHQSSVCGDDFMLFVKYDPLTNRLKDVYVVGTGCVLSEVSLSLFLKTCISESIDFIKKITHNFKNLVDQKQYDATILGELTVLKKISLNSERRNCLLVPYYFMQNIVNYKFK